MKNILYRFSLANLSALFLFFNFGAQAQNTITTFVGTGASGSGGDGGPATAATMTYPHGMAQDASGNIYVTDANGHKIRMITPAGIISTIAGTGTAGYNGEGVVATAAQLNNPFDVAVDAAGNIYFTEAAGRRVRKITGGVVSTIAGNGASGYSGDGGPATAAIIKYGSGIVLDNAGNILFSDCTNNRIRKISTSGTITTFAGNGNITYSGDGIQATATAIYNPGFLRFDATGNLFVSENGGNRIRKITPAGIISTYAGDGTPASTGDGGPATAAAVRAPGGLAFDHDGNLYFGTYGDFVRKITPAGIISSFAGDGTPVSAGDGGPALLASFYAPTGVMVDACNKIYVSEGNGRKVRQITFDNRTPSFTNGATITVTVCGTTADTTVIDSVINSLVAVRDTDRCQSEVWSVVTPPAHGTTGGFTHTMTSNGSVLTPIGLTYSPSLSYIGNDTLKIRVFDGTSSDTIAICVSVISCWPVSESIIKAATPGLTIYPNPSKGAFTVRLNGAISATGASLMLTNVVGATMHEFRMQAKDEEHINLGLPAGIYFLTAKCETGITVSKIVIE